MGTIILNVVIVLGIIIAGGFLIFFLGDLLISIIDPKGEEERVKMKRKASSKKFVEKLAKLPEEDVEEIKDENQFVSEVLEEVSQEENVEKKEEIVPVVEDYVPQDLVEQSEEPSQLDKLAEARKALEKRKEEILRRMRESIENDNVEPEDSDDDDDVEDEVEEEQKTEGGVVLEDSIENVIEENVVLNDEEDSQDQDDNSNSSEKESQVITEDKAVPVNLMSEEEYLKQLAELQTRLRENEKELKECKKEYIPLAKINKTLARDEKKLNRKEAIVAKQKVMLYGVNNYEDLDEDKAKKLAEELDLLDGLKLSVQHCHDVMDANKDRFPILEKMYKILKNQNEQLKADIEEIEEALKKLKNGK